MAIPAAFRHVIVALLAAICRSAAAAVVLMVVATPLSAAGFTLTEPGLAPGPQWSYNHAIARSDTRQLAVWVEETGVKAALLELDGRLISERSFPLDVPKQAHTLQLFGTGDTFTLIAATVGETSWLQIDSSGNVVEQYAVNLGGYPLTPLLWNGQHFAVVVSKPGRVEAQLHAADGSIAHGPFRIDARNETLRLSAAGNDILIASSDRLHLLTPGGVEEIARGAFSNTFAAVATGSGWLLASAEPQSQARLGLVIRQVDASGVRRSDVIAEARVLSPLAFLETNGGYALFFDTYDSIDSILVDRNGNPVEGSRTTRLDGRALAANADGSTISLLTKKTVDGTQRISASLHGPLFPLRSVLVSTTTANQTNPVGAGFEQGALIAFTEVRHRPVIQLVALRSTRPRLVGSIEGSRIASSTLPGNGSEALLLHHRGTYLYATRLSPGGTPLDEHPIRISDEATSPHASATWTGSQWAVAWIDAEDSQAIRFALLDGVEVDERRPVPQRKHSYAITGVELHASRSGFVLAWREHPICSMPCVGWDAIVATLDERGSLRAVTQYALNSSTPSTATDGDTIVAVEGGRARILEESGRALGLRRTFRFREWNTSTHVIWDGDEYVTGATYALITPKVAIDRFMEDSEHSRRKVMDRLNRFAAEPPSVVLLDADEALLLVEELASDGHRIVAYRERDMMPAPPPPPAPLRMNRRVDSGGLVTWEWDGPSGGIVEGYSVELVYGEWSLVLEILPPDAREYTGTSSVRIRAFNDGGLSPVQSDRRRTIAP